MVPRDAEREHGSPANPRTRGAGPPARWPSRPHSGRSGPRSAPRLGLGLGGGQSRAFSPPSGRRGHPFPN